MRLRLKVEVEGEMREKARRGLISLGEIEVRGER